uniref:Putative secreted protein n=1 Tax=Ixodes scapularis TaxID=6945 RepID=A0A4D5RCG1_IXOSC
MSFLSPLTMPSYREIILLFVISQPAGRASPSTLTTMGCTWWCRSSMMHNTERARLVPVTRWQPLGIVPSMLLGIGSTGRKHCDGS